MVSSVTLTIDGATVVAAHGQTILDAATAAGIYIPHLCARSGLTPWGSCRVCTVRVSGRPVPACLEPVGDGMTVENDTPALNTLRRHLIEMLFVEGNHICPFCERSGSCELQALGYRLGMLQPAYPYLYPRRNVEASHPDLFLDHNRCILCARCVRASQELDGKHVYGFGGRGAFKHIIFNSPYGLAGTDAQREDQAAAACPVGALMRKRIGFAVTIGQRPFDRAPIGSAGNEPSGER